MQSIDPKTEVIEDGYDDQEVTSFSGQVARAIGLDLLGLLSAGVLLIAAAIFIGPRAPPQSPDNDLGLLSSSTYLERTEATDFLAPFAAQEFLFTPTEFEPQGFHPGPIAAVAYGPGGQRVLTGGSDGTARLWDAATGAEIQRFEGHGASVRSVAFSPDGAQVLTGSTDGTARLWDTVTGLEIRRFQGYEVHFWSVAFSPDGAQVLTGSDDGTARLWNAATGAELRRFEGHGDNVWSVAFLPDGAQVLTGSDDGTARLWNAATGAELRRFEGHGASVSSVAFSRDGAQVLTGSGDGSARLWNAATGAELQRFEGHGAFVSSIAFSRDGAQVLTGSGDGTARLWNPGTGAEIQRFEGHEALVWSVAFSPDGAQVLTGSEDGSAQLWNAATGTEIQRFEGHEALVRSVAFSPDGAQVLTGSDNVNAHLWDAATGTEIQRFEGHEALVWSVAFSPNGAEVLTGSEDRTARLWNVATGAEIRRFAGHEAPVRSAVFSPDGALVLTGSEDGSAQLWNAATGTEIQRFAGHEAPVRSVAFSPDGAQVLTGSDDGTARLWNPGTGAEIRRFEGHGAFVSSVAFSRDAQVLTGGGDGTARLWNTGTGAEIQRFDGHGVWVWSVAFTPDGAQVLTGRNDGTARLWDAATGAWIGSVSDLSSGPVLSVAISDDGRTIALGTLRGFPYLYAPVPGPVLGPPIWSIASFVVGFLVTVLGCSRFATRLRLLPARPAMAAVFVPDTPLTDPAFAGDTLNVFCTKIARFLLNPNTGAPFSIALTGDWGKGKSSAMKLIQRQLEAESYPVLWFNAWHHQKEEHLFASLMEEIRQKAMPAMTSWRFFSPTSLLARINLLAIRLSARPARFAFLTFIIAFASALFGGLEGVDLNVPGYWQALGGAGLLLFALPAFSRFIVPFQVTGAALLSEGRNLVGMKRFSEKLSFRDQFGESFREVTKALGSKRLTIIIDDLDRCDMDQVIDMMEAINFLTSSGECYIILGIHEAPVRHALGLRKEELARAHAITLEGEGIAKLDDEVGLQAERDRYADFFLEKLLNLRVAVPDFDGKALSNFIEKRIERATTITPKAPAEKLAEWCRNNAELGMFSLNALVLVSVGWIAMMLAANEDVTSSFESLFAAVFPPSEDCSVPPGAEIRRFTGHTSEVGSVAFSPDGKRVITGGPDGVARIWDADTECGEFIQETGTSVAGAPTEDGAARTALVPSTSTDSSTQPFAIEPNEEEVFRAGQAVPAKTLAPEEGDASRTSQIRSLILEQPAWLVLVLFLVPIGRFGQKWVERRRKARQNRELEEGRRDSNAFRHEIEMCLRAIQDPDLTPRILMRFLNLSRFLIAGLPPDDRSVRTRIRLFAIETAKNGIDPSKTSVDEIQAWMAQNSDFKGDTSISSDDLDDYLSERRRLSF
ncbi:MAG: P-loop NTPase fold protein [Pseudomonadota bacterium]